jgi:uncharacterized ferredoxin-like protein
MTQPSELQVMSELSAKLEQLAQQWDAEGKTEDAAHIRRDAPAMVQVMAKAAAGPIGLDGVYTALRMAARASGLELPREL